MDQKFFETLEIVDVWQKESSFIKTRIDIFFSIDNIAYKVNVEKDHSDGIYRPEWIIHVQETYFCKLCKGGNPYGGCNFFFPIIQQLFEHLINFPSIRLEWLFIKHV